MNNRSTADQPSPPADRGGAEDSRAVFGRRTALRLLAGAGALAIAGCADDDAASSTSPPTSGTPSTSGPSGTSRTTGTTGMTGTAGTTTPASDAASVAEIPEETAGPFPGDGSNGPNVLTEDGVVRSDITSSFGSMTGVAEGVPLTLELALVDAANGSPLAGAAVYVWQCDREGLYSLYSDGATDQNYLRGVQEADASGTVTFTSIFPAAYTGRWPHVHFEVYASLAEATAAGEILATSQLAFPEDVCDTVYASDGYEQSVQNMTALSLETDGVFSDDGAVDQLATITGSVEDGYVATLVVGV